MMSSNEVSNPIDAYNLKRQAAAELARKQSGLVLAGRMLGQLRVISVAHNRHLALVPTKPYLYKSIMKRQEKILQAIQLVAEEITSITIISGE